MARPPSEHPTDGELEILRILWDAGPSELGRICHALREHRQVATTTVATMLKVMLDKDLVRRAQGPRGYQWSARVSRKSTNRGLLRKLLDAAFEGSAQRMVAHLIQDGALTAKDRQELRRLLEADTSGTARRGQQSGTQSEGDRP